MRILQVANVRWHNAAADYALKAAEGLRRRGHQVSFAAPPGAPPASAARRMGLEVIETGWPLRLARGDWDVVDAHFPAGFPLLALAQRRAGPRTVLVRTRGDMRPPGDGAGNRLVYGSLADGVTASGDAVAAMVRERLGLGPEKVRVIRYALDTEAFRPGLPPPDLPGPLPPGAPVVGYVGRLGEVKGERHLVRFISLVAAAHPGAVFVLGLKEEDGQPARIEQELSAAGLLQRAVVLGRVADVAALMGCFTVGIISSVGSEANCRVLEEMMACGVPVVATAVGVIPEVMVSGETGMLVPPRSPEALAWAVGALLKDAGMRNRMACASRRRAVDEFSLPLMARRLEEWYLELAARRAGRR